MLPLIASLCLLQTPGHLQATPLVVPPGHITKVVTGKLAAKGGVSYYFLARAGQTLVVNAYGMTPGFEVIATVLLPNGGQDGQKGTPNYSGRVEKTGTYRVTIGRNLMASTVDHGSYTLEVVLF